MAIDYGRKRCGIAVTDSLRISANGLPTQRTCDLMNFIKSYCKDEKVDVIVVGLPLTMHGEASESSKYIEPFIRQLKREMSDMPIERFDERFTSTLAHMAMIEGGLKKSARREKGLADKMAAVIILTSWLEAKELRIKN